MNKILKTSVLAIVLATSSTIAADVIGTVDGLDITKTEANKFLKAVTPKDKKVQTYDKLDKDQKKSIIQSLAPGILIKNKAKKSVTKEEIEQLVANYWMQKELAKYKATDSEAKAVYDNDKKIYQAKGKQLTFDKVKDFIKMQLKQKKLIDALMKKAKVVIK
jgi:hypothetical protein